MDVTRGSGSPSLDAAGQAALSNVLRRHVGPAGPPAAVAIVVSADRVLFLDAAGRRDAARDVAATSDTIFRIASMTKPVTSLAAMLLVDDGVIALDDPVTRHLPDYVQPPVVTAVRPDRTADVRPASRAITVRDLLTHTSGIAYPPFDPVLRRLATSATPMPLLFDPGTRFQYGPGTALLGRLVAAAAGHSLDEFCQARIFEPLGMLDTAYEVPTAQGGRVATQHQRLADGTLAERANPETHVSKGRGDDGLFSTAADYGAFMQLFLTRGTHRGRRIVSESAIDLMSTNQIGPLTVQPVNSPDPLMTRTFPAGAGKDHFGLGFQIETPPSAAGRRSPGSLSWGGIFNTHFWIDPARGVAAAALMQMLPINDQAVVDLLAAFERTVYAHLV